jgi:hypothetical protein
VLENGAVPGVARFQIKGQLNEFREVGAFPDRGVAVSNTMLSVPVTPETCISGVAWPTTKTFNCVVVVWDSADTVLSVAESDTV